MAKINWLDLLEWDDNQLNDIRMVAYAYLKQGQYDVALKLFKMLNVIKPNTPYDIQTLGAIYLQTGKNLEALSLFDQAIKLQPNHYPTLLNRGKALLYLGYKKQAIEQIRQLLYCPERDIATQASALISTYM